MHCFSGALKNNVYKWAKDQKQLMEGGETGDRGYNVQGAVGEEFLILKENAITQYQPIKANSV